MRLIHYHKTPEGATYCFREEVLERLQGKFDDYLRDHERPEIIVGGVDETVFYARDVKDFLESQGYSTELVVEDESSVYREIRLGKLEVMD